MRHRLATLARSGAPELIVATAVAGGAGYVITVVAGVQLGPSVYVAFGVLWSSLYLVLGTLNGAQQEVARATRPAEQGSGGRVVRDVVLGIAAAALLLTIVTYPLWGPLIFASTSLLLALPIAIGLFGHTIATSLTGMLHGLRQVRLVASIVIFDALLRLVVTVVLLGVTTDIAIISWGLVLPLVVAPVVLWILARKRLARASTDVNRRALLRNIGSTMIAAIASGAMVAGVSLLIAAAGIHTPAAHVGAVIFAVNITRAPLIIAVTAFQNYMVVRLRDRADWLRLLVRVVIIAIGGTVVFSGVVAIVGEQLFAFLLDGERVEPLLLALITASGGLTSLLSLTGAGILARGRHAWFTIGWVVAAATTCVTLFLVPDFDTAVVAALIAGPLAGLAVHSVAIAFDRHPPVDSPPSMAPVDL